MKTTNEKYVQVGNSERTNLGTEGDFDLAASEIIQLTGGSSLGGGMSMLWGFLHDYRDRLRVDVAQEIAREAAEFQRQFGKGLSQQANDLLSALASLSAKSEVAPSSLDRLAAIGFKEYGEWQLNSGQLKCELQEDAAAKNVLYAFVSGADVLYIGKTNQSLKRRLYGYQNPGESQRTNIRGNARLKQVLTDGLTIKIYAFPDNGLLHYGGFHVNLAAGLEDALIADLNPEWNINGMTT